MSKEDIRDIRKNVKKGAEHTQLSKSWLLTILNYQTLGIRLMLRQQLSYGLRLVAMCRYTPSPFNFSSFFLIFLKCYQYVCIVCMNI